MVWKFSNRALYSISRDTAFFLKNRKSDIEAWNVFDRFWKVSGLKLNTWKSEITEIGSLKGVNMALWYAMY